MTLAVDTVAATHMPLTKVSKGNIMRQNRQGLFCRLLAQKQERNEAGWRFQQALASYLLGLQSNTNENLHTLQKMMNELRSQRGAVSSPSIPQNAFYLRGNWQAKRLHQPQQETPRWYQKEFYSRHPSVHPRQIDL